MFKSYFDGEGGDPLDIAHQYAMTAAASSSNLPPNLEDVSFNTRYPWGNSIQMPSNVAFKTLQIIIQKNAEKYNVSKKLVDEFKVISDEWEAAPNKATRDIFRDEGRTFYKDNNIYDAVVQYHRANP